MLNSLLQFYELVVRRLIEGCCLPRSVVRFASLLVCCSLVRASRRLFIIACACTIGRNDCTIVRASRRFVPHLRCELGTVVSTTGLASQLAVCVQRQVLASLVDVWSPRRSERWLRMRCCVVIATRTLSNAMVCPLPRTTPARQPPTKMRQAVPFRFGTRA